MAGAYPDKAYRVLKLDDRNGERKSVLIGLHRSEDVFTEFSVSSTGFGEPAFLTPCLSLKAQCLSNDIAISDELERAVCQMELNGYDLISDVDTMVHELPELLANVQAPTWSTADSYFEANKDSLEEVQLVEVTSGIRAWIVIDENLQFIDAKSLKPLQAVISQHELGVLLKALTNEALGRTILESFIYDGAVVITDAIRINGFDTSEKSYSSIMHQLRRVLPKSVITSDVSSIKLAEPVTNIEHSIRILANSDSALRPALYAKHNRRKPVLIDRYRGFEIQFAQTKKGLSTLNYVDFDFSAERTQMPLQNFPAFDNEYTAIGIRPGTDRIPILF